MSDAVVTGWRTYKNDNPLVGSDSDKVMSLWVAANRWGPEDIIRNYNYYADRRLIEGIYSGTIKQIAAVEMKDN